MKSKEKELINVILKYVDRSAISKENFEDSKDPFYLGELSAFSLMLTDLAKLDMVKNFKEEKL